ncbi:MAG TPA: queuosine precursor transporter [Gammaproteobacteria bacterium]|nr:queuosine precursor transporter [Gammaproteobacteria bacterium]
MKIIEAFKNFVFTWLYRIQNFFDSHYSYELEGFSLEKGQTSVIYRVQGKYQTYKRNLIDCYNDQAFLSSFSPLNVKQICQQYFADSPSTKDVVSTNKVFYPIRIPARRQKYLPCLGMLYIGLLTTSILLSPNLVRVGPYTEPGGILLFPLTYLLADTISEVYGYQIVRLIIWSVLLCLTIVTIGICASIMLPPLSSKANTEYIHVFGNMPRLFLANGISIVLSDFSNAYFFSKLKIVNHGKYLWLRVIGASAMGEITYTIIWIFIFFITQLSLGQMISMAVQNYFFKVVYSAFFIPLFYILSSKLKKAEGLDTYDYNISYNMFSTKLDDFSKSKE